MEMKSKVRSLLLVLVDSFLVCAMVAVLPFAWMLRDGLGPDSVPTAGFTALARTFTTFHVGPAILLLTSLDLLIRSRTQTSVFSRRAFIVPVVIILALAALGIASFRWMSGHQ